MTIRALKFGLAAREGSRQAALMGSIMVAGAVAGADLEGVFALGA
jgi:hypothetical protein